jgi:nucleoid DNA-binding protein/nucleoid-associated protein YgaU
MNTKITFVELVDMIAESTSTTKRVCELFVKELFATVSQALIDGEQVKIKGIGTFKVARMKPRKGVDVNTGEPIQIESHNKLTFTPDKSLAEAINQPFAQFETVVLDDDVTDEKLAAIDEEHPSAIPETPIITNDIGGTLADEFPEFHEPLPATEPDEFFVPEPIGSPKPVQEEKQKLEPAPEPEPEPEPMPAKVIEPEPVAVESEPVKTAEPKPVKPVLEEPEPVDNFYRPEPRNVYTPTQEQIDSASARSKLKRWLWALLAALVLGILGWLIFGGSDNGNKQNAESSQEVAPVDSDATTVEASSVITDTVTSKIVLSTLSDRYYDSPWFWVYIYEENKNIISDPNNVKPGTIVVIPPAEKYGIDANDPASLKKAQRLSWEILKGK